MKRDGTIYLNYVCPNCFNTINDCTCIFFPPYTAILIDKGIQEHIRILNNKRYRTIGCCEGHYKERCISTYICFAQEYNFDEIPKGFKYNKNKRMIYFEYSLKLSKEKMEEIKKEKLSNLLQWCKKLNKL